MGKWCRLATSFQRPTLDPDIFSHDNNISLVLNDNVSVDFKVTHSVGIRVKNNCPFARDSNVISIDRQDSIWPLSHIAPVPERFFLGTAARWCWAKVSAVNGIDGCVLVQCSVSTTGAQMQNSLVISVVMVVISVATSAGIEVISARDLDQAVVEGFSLPDGTDFVKLTIVCILDFENDS